MNITTSAKTLHFSVIDEDRKSFLDKFVSGEEFVIKTTDYTYHLILAHIATEDGEKSQRFLFRATVVKAKSNTGLSVNVKAYYQGYLDCKNKSGWMKAIDAIVW